MGEPDLVGKGLKAVRADVRVIFPPLYPLMVDQGARGHRSLQSVILAERLSKWIPCNRAANPLKVSGWISSGLYGNINRIKVTCNSVINEMPLVSKIKCSAIKLFI